MSALSRTLGVVAVAVAAAVLLAEPRGGTAAPQPGIDLLACVPADAALFVHVDAQAIGTSKFGSTLRKAFEEAGGPKDLAPPDAMKKEMLAKEKNVKDKMGMPARKPNSPVEVLREFERVTGIKEADVASFTLYMPRLKGPGDEQVLVFGFTLSKPYDKAKLLEGLTLLDTKIEKEVSPGVYQLADGREDKPRLVLTDPTRIVILGPKVKEMPTPRTAGAAGPLAAAIADAPKQAATLGLNFANLPDEIRGDNLPPQVEPFKPLLQADAIVATLAMGDRITLNLRARCDGREKAIEAEKAMGVARTLFQTLLNLGSQEMDKSKEPGLVAVKPLLQTAQEALKTAQFGNTDTEAFAKLSVPADIDIGPLVKLLTGGVQTAAARSVSQNNLKQLGLAMHNYHDTHGRFPAAATVGRKGKLLLSWRVAVLPYIEQDTLYREFKLDEPWDSEHNKKVFDKYPMPKVYAVPGVTGPMDKTTHYQVFRGNGALFEVAQGFQIQNVTDGTSNTIMVATAKTPVPWTKPDDLEFDPKGDPRELLLFVEDLCNVAFADGSVRALRKTISKEALLGAITRSGGEVINLD